MIIEVILIIVILYVLYVRLNQTPDAPGMF
jgi:hypothetical protein